MVLRLLSQSKGNRASRIGRLTWLKGKELVIMLLKYLRLWGMCMRGKSNADHHHPPTLECLGTDCELLVSDGST